jgi:hypothetical protein
MLVLIAGEVLYTTVVPVPVLAVRPFKIFKEVAVVVNATSSLILGEVSVLLVSVSVLVRLTRVSEARAGRVIDVVLDPIPFVIVIPPVPEVENGPVNVIAPVIDTVLEVEKLPPELKVPVVEKVPPTVTLPESDSVRSASLTFMERARSTAPL